MQELLTATSFVMRERLGTDGSLPCSALPKSKRSLKRMNILLRDVVTSDRDRYTLLSRLFGRDLRSSSELLYSEVRAFLQVAYTGKEIDQLFIEYLKEIAHHDEPV